MIKKIILAAVAFSVLFTAAAYAQDTYCNTISCDNQYYYAVKTDGSLYRIPFAGDNGEDSYTLPLEDMVPEKFMENVLSVSCDCVLKEGGFLWKWDNDYEPAQAAENVKSVSSNGSTMLFVKNDNTLWGMGDNSVGQLAQGTLDKSVEQQQKDDLKWKNKTECSPKYYDEPVKIMDDVKSAVIDGTVSAVLKNDSTVWTFGADQGCAALGIGGKWLVNNEPQQILSGAEKIFLTYGAGFAADSDNTLWRWGSNYMGYSGGNSSDSLIPEKYTENVKYAANMPGYNLIIKTDGSLWIYGDTDKDNGDIGYTSSDAPVKLADNAAYAVGLKWMDDLQDEILVLKDSGDLMLYVIPRYDDTEPYLIGKVMSNVRLPNEVSVNVNFTDISGRSEEKAINSLGKAGIISGISDTEFAPDKAITRAETAKLLLKLTASEYENESCGFADVTENDWYYGVAGASAKYGIVKGFEDNTFRGDDTVSEVQLVSLCARALRDNHMNIAQVNTDAVANDNIPAWAEDDLKYAYDYGLLSKDEYVSLEPNKSITRADAAEYLYRLYKLV